LGLITGFDDILLFILRTILLEFSILYVNQCNYTKIDLNSGLYSVLLGVISYIFGSILKILMKSDNLIYYYIIGSVLSTIIYLIAKCYFQFDKLDKFLYNNDESIIEFVLFRFVYYFILGYIFQFNGLFSSIIQTIIIEFLIAYVERCQINNINWETGILSIIIGLTSYLIGATISYYYNK
tara:strand:+ start:6128 stop:6670 length:543 start_codon:yes stop_codon:yes gene_type:complete